MQAILGVLFHFLGGFASGSFYMPYKKVKGWSWESYWIVGGLFSWLVVPPLAAWLTIPDFWQIISQTSSSTLFYTYLFGLLWGIGGLTYGLGVRYLGVSLGSSIILGLCMVFGSLIPSLYYQFSPQEGKDSIGDITGSTWGLTMLGGLAICIVGIFLCGKAGTMKERQMQADLLDEHPGSGDVKPVKPRKHLVVAEAIDADNGSTTAVFEEVAITPQAPPSAHGPAGTATEYKFVLGLTVSIISGILSACFNFGLEDYDFYVIIPHFLEETENACKVINTLQKEKLILLDKLVPGVTGKFGAVYANFENDIFNALQEALPQLIKYNVINIIFPEFSYHPDQILTGFKKFCQEYAFQGKVVHQIEKETIRKGEVYINLMEDDLVVLIEKILALGFKIGEEVGVISYNETALKKIILNGITTISTDFQMMGERAADLVLNNSLEHVEVNFHLTLRHSL